MKTLITLCFVFSLLTIAAQEQVTNILNDGQGSRILLQEIDSLNFVCVITNDDVVRVFQEQADELIYMHERKIKNVFQNRKFEFLNNYLLGGEFEGSFAYDLKKDTLIHFPFNDGYDRSSIRVLNDSEVFLSHSNSPVGQNYLVNIEEPNVDTLEYLVSILYASDLYLHIRDKRNSNKVYHHVIERSTSDTLFSHNEMLYNGQYLMNDQYFIYKEENKFEYFDLQQKKIKTLIDIQGDNTTSSNLLAVDSFYISYSDYPLKPFVIYNNSLKPIKSKILDYPIGAYPYVLHGNIFLYGYEKSFSIDIETFDVTEYSTDIRSLDEMILVDDRYIYSKFGSKIHQIDLKEKTENLGNDFIFKNEYFKMYFFESGDKLYVNFDSEDENDHSLYTLKSTLISPSDLTGDYNSGLSLTSSFYKTKDGIAIVDNENIYGVDASNVLQVYSNSAEFIKTDENLSSDGLVKITWLERDNGDVFAKSLDGGELKVFGPIPNVNSIPEIREYSVGSSVLYYHLANNEEPRLFGLAEFNLEAVPIGGVGTFLFGELYSHNDDLYIIRFGELFHKLHTATTATKFFISPYVLGPIQFKDKLYFTANDGLYQIDGGSMTHVIDDNLNSNYFENTGKYLILPPNNIAIVDFDGLNSHKHILDYPYYWSSVLDSNNIILNNIYHPEAPMMKFNIEEQVFQEISGDITDKHIHDRFSIGNYSILAVTNDVIDPSILYFYITNAEMDEYQLFYETPVDSDFYKFSFIDQADGALCYSGNDIFYISSDLEIVKYNNVKGENKHSKFIENNGKIYFSAIGTGVGRQIFSIDKISVNNQNVSLSRTFDIKPNPASNLISVPIEFRGHRFGISSISGDRILNGIVDNTNSISISSITSGMYILSIHDGTSVQSSRVVVVK